MRKQYEYDTRTIRDHPDGGKEHGWTNKEHEMDMLAYAGIHGWELCAMNSVTFQYYFKREIIEDE